MRLNTRAQQDGIRSKRKNITTGNKLEIDFPHALYIEYLYLKMAQS